MREWILENTNITPEQYDKYLQNEYLNSGDIPKGIIRDPKRQLLFDIEVFTVEPRLRTRFSLGVKKSGKKYTLRGISFGLLSDLYDDPNLFTANRYGKCIEKSLPIALNNDVDIVTALCTDHNGKRYLHTFLIGKIENHPVAIDYTLNLVIGLDDYLDLLEVEQITLISNAEFKNYLRIYQEFMSKYPNTEERNNCIPVHMFEFLIFPKEISEVITRQ